MVKRDLEPELQDEVTHKIFYVAAIGGDGSVEWPTDNFTNDELDVIERFLKELNEHASAIQIDAVVIMDND